MKYWKPGYGSISIDEFIFIDRLIKKFKPRSFLEVGTASGLSAGLIANSLKEIECKKFISIDHDNTFFGDKTLPNGFLISQIYQGKDNFVNFKPFKTSIDILDISTDFEMCFIDANHQHPWPTIDTMMLYPFIKGKKIMIHHDLNLYKLQSKVVGLGPKILYDQFPARFRHRARANNGNIFFLNLTLDENTFYDSCIDSLLFPWTLSGKLNDKHYEKIISFLKLHYPKEIHQTFINSYTKFSPR